ncbi:hypothetical protein LCGC14_1545260 [marine sediment metagenome]|uniref:Uncharacterized protein n=1 Tax=marine sediment metagenome TaxID=412755 RepID=A0A0F9IRS4_9ZZZZ
MKACEELKSYGIEKCPECHCSTGHDTEYKDFSNKNIAICGQCGYEWYLSDYYRKEVTENG